MQLLVWVCLRNVGVSECRGYPTKSPNQFSRSSTTILQVRLQENSISNGFICDQESSNSDTPSLEHPNYNIGFLVIICSMHGKMN